MEHSRLLPPSGAPSWGFCSGSAILAAQFPKPETDASREGTATHWVAAETLRAVRGDHDGGCTCGAYVGTPCPENGVVVTEEMAEGAQVYVDEVLRICQDHGALRSLLIEHKVHAPQIHPDNWGTLDAAVPLLDQRVIYLVDAKFGHRDNRARENLQLINYAAGLVNELKIDGHMEQQVLVVFRIVQPFCYHGGGPVNEWTCTLADLRAYWNQLHHQAQEITTGVPTFTTGVHCRDCVAVGRCSAARKAGYAMFDYVKQPYQIDTMTGAELATEREQLETAVTLAKARLEALDDDLVHRIKAGEADTGLTLETKYGRTKWTVAPPVVVELAAQFGIDARKDDVLTPAQVTAKIPADKRDRFKRMLHSMTLTPRNGLKLVKAADSKVAAAFRNTH